MSEHPPLPDFDKLWNYHDPAATEQKFRALLPDAEQSGDTSYLLCLLTQIARTEGLQKRFDDAHRTLDRVEAGLGEELQLPRIRCLLERGRVWNSSGQPQTARPFFEQAWNAARAASEDAHAVDAAHMLAIVEPPEDALRWNLQALELAEGSEQPRARKWVGSLLNNLGWTHHDAGRLTEALDLFRRALEWRQTEPDATAIRIARWCVARALRSLGRLDEALAIQRSLLEELQRAGEKDPHVDEEIAEIQKAQAAAAS